jgi:hypothetical protein
VRRRWTQGISITVLVAAGLAASALAVVVREGTLQIMASAQLKPYKLPRVGTAPINAFIAGHIATTDGSTPPQLRKMDVKLNRHGVLDTRGLPRCRRVQLSPATYEQALSRCRRSLVGSGHFWASVVLPDQPSYKTTGRLLVFNGSQDGRPALFAHIYTSIPFPSSFVVTFGIRRIDKGPYGTELTASLPQSLGDWGFVDRIKMTIGRSFRYHGRRRGYLSAGCPALKGVRTAVFPLALASFSFAEDKQVRILLTRSCGVRE